MSKYLKIVFFITLWWVPFMALTQDTIPLNTTRSFEVNEVNGYTYSWWYANEAGDITQLQSTTHETEEYLWDTEGDFQLFVQASDAEGCLSEIISQDFVVAELANDLIVFAGNDTTIASCEAYTLQGFVSDPTGLSYVWSPSENLDDATLLNPVFTPVESTEFVLTINDSEGNLYTDTVQISVAEIFADAGENRTIEAGETIQLDGTNSRGNGLQYLWTSNDGNIVNGANTATPVVNAAGTYLLEITDSFGCTATDLITLTQTEDRLPVIFAGNDTLVGGCAPYQLQATASNANGATYLWEPADNLNDATLLNPTFTPGTTTTFILTASNAQGAEVKDTVTVSISEIVADAGDDFVIEADASAILDGNDSEGEELSFLWTTDNGEIESGQNTATPIISSPGTYFLEVEDIFGCFDTDSVVVSLVTYAPVAVDDYDTTNFETAVRIDVLANDSDPDGDLDPSSLRIEQFPANGSVYINFDDYTVTYTPNNGYVGNDVFQYQICDLTAQCDNASVFVHIPQVNFFIPDAFTPNNDGTNDFFEIVGIEYYEGNSLSIVNRWGKAVYDARNYGISTTPRFWDGTWQRNGGDVPTGTYYYILDLGNGQQPIAGSVYIDR